MPISFEVFADDPISIYKQAKIISSWGKNVNVKIPITTTKGENLYGTIKKLSDEGVQLNITAILTLDQVIKKPAHGENAPTAVCVSRLNTKNYVTRYTTLHRVPYSTIVSSSVPPYTSRDAHGADASNPEPFVRSDGRLCVPVHAVHERVW